MALVGAVLLLFGGAAFLSAADDPFAGEDSETDTITQRPKEAPKSDGSADPLSAVKPGMPSRFFRDRKGVDVPIIDDKGEVVFNHPSVKSPSEMNEEDFFKSMTPAEKVILTTPPVSAPDYFEAAVRISRVGRPEFAKILAEKGLQAEGTPAEYAALIDSVGEDKLIAFGHNMIVGEAASKSVDIIFEEAKKEWRDPAHIRDAFDRAGARSPEIRAAALADLKRGYPDSFDYLLERLDSTDGDQSARAASILAEGGVFAAEGLLARARICDEEELRRLAPILEKSVGLPEVTPLVLRYYDEEASADLRDLLGKVIAAQTGGIPTAAEESEWAYRRGMAYFEGKIVLPNTVGGEYPIWNVQEDGTLRREMVPTETALRTLAAQSLGDAYRLNPSDRSIRAAAQVAAAEMILYRDGLDSPPNIDEYQSLFPDLTTEDSAAALHLALESGHEKGGIIPVTLLEDSGDSSLCVGENGPSDLVRAAVSRDRRLRFAALRTIVSLAPDVSYTGSSSVTASLIWFTTSAGKRRAIVAAPDMETIGEVGNFISDGEILTTPAGTGRDILTKAQNDADVEFVVTLSDVKTPDPRAVAQALAADFRTHDVPILIVFEDDTRRNQARRYGEGEPNAEVSVIPFDTESGKRLIGELYAKTDPRQVPADVRFRQAKEAIEMLTRLNGTGKNAYYIEDVENLALRFLATPATYREGIDFAMTVPAKSIQVALSQLTFDGRFDADTRHRYLDALSRHIGKYGLLLRGPDILSIFSGPWPGDSGEARKTFFRLIADNTPEKSEIALSIPSAHIQNLLGDLVADSDVETERREEALDLFRRHLAKYGLLLDRPEVNRLYDQYNATENSPELDQRLTGEVLEAIEAWQSGHLGI
ncbi:MAG: hypothetical protein J6S40_06330 [Thermoguttaceae bacterium]|nr:hypothetical protein [Thermoguttaceae bacterium]